MTRGKFIFILSYDTFLVSEEYNGDMYLNYSDDGTRILCNNAIGSFLNYFLDKFKDSKRILYKEMQEALVGEKENYRKEMKGVDWGYLYDFARRHRQDLFNPSEETKVSIRKEVTRLMSDVDVTSKRGVYDYVVTGRESSLSLRTFDEATKRTVYERQGGVCLKCGRHFDIDDMDADHILPWSKGGRTTIDNCQMLCKSCNRKKSDY